MEDTYSGSILEPLSQNCYTYTGNNPVNLADPSGHAWGSGTVAKVAAVAKKAAPMPGAVKSGAAAAKKTITTTKNTTSNNNQKNKGTGKLNVSGRPTTANIKQQKIITTSSKAPGSSSAKKSWGGAITSSVTGIAAGVVRRITPGHSYINNKLFTASSANERKLCSGAARLVKDTASAESSQLKDIANKIEKILRKTTAGFTGLVASLYGNLILATEPVNSFSNSMYAMSQLIGYTIGGKLGEMEYFLAGQIVGDKISSAVGGLIQAAGKTVSQFGTALDIYMAWNGVGGGKPSAQIVGGGSVAIEGNAVVGGIGTIAGVAIGGAISAFGENLKDSAEENEALHEEQLEKLSEEKSGIYKEVNAHGQIDTELDEVDLKNGII